MLFRSVSTITYHLSYRYIRSHEAADLYKEANLIASDYASSYYNNTITLSEFEERLEALSHYLSAQIWIVGTNGDILVNSAQKADLSNIETIEGFNITDFGSEYCRTGHFYGRFKEERLSVYAPISINYKVRGYVFLHKPTSAVILFNNGLLHISYFTLDRKSVV